MPPYADTSGERYSRVSTFSLFTRKNIKKKKNLATVFGHIHLRVYCFAMLVRSNHHPNQQFLVRHFIKLLSHDLHYSVLKLEASFLIHIKYLLTLECVRKTIWGLCLVYRDCSPATFL